MVLAQSDELVDVGGAGTDDGVGRTPVEAHGTGVVFEEGAAGEDHVGHVAGAFPRVVGFKDPRVGDADDPRRVVEVVEGDAEAVDVAGHGRVDAVDPADNPRERLPPWQ